MTVLYTDILALTIMDWHYPFWPSVFLHPGLDFTASKGPFQLTFISVSKLRRGQGR